jgi:hypothetical protein
MTADEPSGLPEDLAKREDWGEEQRAQWRQLRQRLADLTLDAHTDADPTPVYTIRPDLEYRSVALYRDGLFYEAEALDPDDRYPLLAAAFRLVWKTTYSSASGPEAGEPEERTGA